MAVKLLVKNSEKPKLAQSGGGNLNVLVRQTQEARALSLPIQRIQATIGSFNDRSRIYRESKIRSRKECGV